jgi:hypothetical protein
MRSIIYLSAVIFGLLFFSCGTKEKQGTEDSSAKVNVTEIKKEAADTVSNEPKKNTGSDPDSILSALKTLPDSAFVEVNPLGNYFAFDMKYATTDNFLE